MHFEELERLLSTGCSSRGPEFNSQHLHAEKYDQVLPGIYSELGTDAFQLEVSGGKDWVMPSSYAYTEGPDYGP